METHECPTKPLSLDEAIAHADEAAGDCSTACKREHKQLADWLRELKSRRIADSGDCAKLREALEAIDKNTDLLDIAENIAPKMHPSHSYVAVQIRKIVRAALAAPPRNCDVIGNTGRALVVHGFPTKSNQWGEGEWLEFVDWLLAPATEKEGGGNAD